MKPEFTLIPAPMFHSRLMGIILFPLLLLVATVSHAVALKDHPELQSVADELISEKRYTQDELDAVFSKATVQQSVLDAMQNPAEYKFTWGKYRKLFMQEERIQQGVDFWLLHEDAFTRAEREYGVPASVIVAIIGVESKFGKYKGKHKVLDSLVSLVTGYPRRSKFFARELKEFLILTKENNLDSSEILGSYAGAVGYPQFISSSYRNYAVDFSGDGKVDLIDQPVDAVGSIANYFIENGWLTGQPVTSQAHTSVPEAVQELANRKRKVQYSAQSLIGRGARIDEGVPASEKLNVLMLDASEVVSEPRSSNVYIVRAGDTACQIAEKHSVPCKSLFALNNLNDKGAIYRGQRLKLPPAKTAPKPRLTTIDSSSKWQVKSADSTVAESDSDIEPPAQVQARYFYTHENFYVITRYNHSVLYAMAVHELSQAIDSAKQSRDTNLTDAK